GVDLAARRPQRVLHDFLRVRGVARDANGQAVDAISVGAHEGLRRPRVRSSQLRHESGVRIDGLSREARRLLVHPGLLLGPFSPVLTRSTTPLSRPASSCRMRTMRVVYSPRCSVGSMPPLPWSSPMLIPLWPLYAGLRVRIVAGAVKNGVSGRGPRWRAVGAY